jgi:GrpB-like predicted nucleotidyltransferase (UPF0157 family)
MLRVGLTGDGAELRTVRSTFVELGAVALDIGGRLPVDEPGIVLVDLPPSRASEESWQHLVVAARPSTGAPGQGATPLVFGEDVVLRGDDAALGEAAAALWRDRLVPFEANLRTGTRAPRRRQPLLVAPRPSWASDAARLIGRLDAAIGALAVRIDHIGSTAVPGLPAKDLIDIQVTVRDLVAAGKGAAAARRAGLVPVRGEWYGEDRRGTSHPEMVAVDADPGRPVNVNFRPMQAPVWREALLFRDWLRAHADERAAYAALKRRLAGDTADVDDYGEQKMPWIRAALGRAERWAQACSWEP